MLWESQCERIAELWSGFSVCWRNFIPWGERIRIQTGFDCLIRWGLSLLAWFQRVVPFLCVAVVTVDAGVAVGVCDLGWIWSLDARGLDVPVPGRGGDRLILR